MPLQMTTFVNILAKKEKLQQSPVSSVGSNSGCQSSGCEFKPQLSKSHCDKCHLSSTNVEKQPDALKDCCVKYWCGKALKLMSK